MFQEDSFFDVDAAAGINALLLDQSQPSVFTHGDAAV